MNFIKIHDNCYNLQHTIYSFNPNKISFKKIENDIKNLKLFLVEKKENKNFFKQLDGSFKKYGSTDLLVDVYYQLQNDEQLKCIKF
jgi:hypothetical protein